MTNKEIFLEEFTINFSANNLIKITIGNLREKRSYLKNVFVKPVNIKGGTLLSFVYRYIDKDVTKNYEIDAAIKEILHLLKGFFLNAEMYSSHKTYYYTEGKDAKTKLITKVLIEEKAANIFTHDKVKHKHILANAMYLHALGVSTAEGKIKADKQHKFKQINSYIEIIDGILSKQIITEKFNVVDMGSGKGYLTFALYDFLHSKKNTVCITGVEQREELVKICNDLALQCNFTHLKFVKNTIQHAELIAVDMLIALHACDTATDDAIAKGIKANATYIICAPCCHKQIRKEIHPTNGLQYITKHGILLERQAEMVTDTIRSLILEAHGYHTKIFDFIDAEHTPKNVLIVATKKIYSKEIYEKNIEKIASLKNLFGINKHYLETIL